MRGNYHIDYLFYSVWCLTKNLQPGCVEDMRGRGLEQRVCDGTVDCPDFSGHPHHHHHHPHHHHHHHHHHDYDHEDDDLDYNHEDEDDLDLDCDVEKDDGNADCDHEEDDDDDPQPNLHYQPHICNYQMSCTAITAPKSTSTVGCVRHNF